MEIFTFKDVHSSEELTINYFTILSRENILRAVLVSRKCIVLVDLYSYSLPFYFLLLLNGHLSLSIADYLLQSKR